jgi:hypothetical protein
LKFIFFLLSYSAVRKAAKRCWLKLLRKNVVLMLTFTILGTMVAANVVNCNKYWKRILGQADDERTSIVKNTIYTNYSPRFLTLAL